MGARTDSTLNEIESIRSRLQGNVSELERRLPPLAHLGRKAVGVALGGGMGGAAFWFAVRRIRSRSKPAEAPEPAVAPVVVNVLPKAAVPVAVGVAAIWAGVRLYEARLRSEAPDAVAEPAVVRSMPGAERGAS